MRVYPALLFLTVVALAGCESVSERVEARFTPVPPKTRVFAGDERTVRAAVKVAFKRLDYGVGSTAGSGGDIEATGRISHSEALGDSRQLIATVHLQEMGPAQTEVRILLSEEVEDASSGIRSEQDLREHGFYETFFETVQQVLTAQSHPDATDSGK